MLERVLGPGNRYGHADIPRDHRKHPRRSLHEFLDVSDASKRIMNDVLVSVRQMCLAADLLDVVTISLGRWNPSCRCMRLTQVACIRQVRHYVSDGGRT